MITTATARAFWIKHALWPLWVIIPVLAGIEFTTADRFTTDLFYDPVSHSFPLRDNFWLEVVMHHWLKYLVVVIAIIVLVAWLLSFHHARLGQWRAHLRYVFVAMVAASAMISGLN